MHTLVVSVCNGPCCLAFKMSLVMCFLLLRTNSDNEFIMGFNNIYSIWNITYIHTHSHESRVKHVVIENKRDSVAGMLYHITPNGPFFSSLNELIDEARKRPLIQNHIFDITLTQCPPKVGGLQYVLLNSQCLAKCSMFIIHASYGFLC